MPASAERMTTTNPLRGKPCSGNRSMRLKSLDGELRTGGSVAATTHRPKESDQQRRDRPLIKSDDND